MENTNLLSFKTKALRYQKWYRHEKFPNSREEKYVFLSDLDAEAGKIFYPAIPEIFEEANKKGIKVWMKNMLRSEHIPFNFFIPLKLNKKNPLVIGFVRDVFPGIDIRSIECIKIEYPPKSKPLKDRTSFDVFILYKNSPGKNCGIGIEVKYTEKSYPYGATEHKMMFDPSSKSKYHEYTIPSIFKHDSIPTLRVEKVKQLWRNHLLGIALTKMRESDHEKIQDFHSVQLYPEGNSYQREACDDYLDCLTDEGKMHFSALTYEDFIKKGRRRLNKDTTLNEWLNYLDERYIVKEGKI